MGVPTNPELLREHFHQLEFRLRRIGRICQAQSIRNPFYMGIHHDRGDMKNISQNQIPRLAADTGEGGERVDILRNLTPVLFDQNRCASFDILRLVVIKAGRMNILFEIF